MPLEIEKSIASVAFDTLYIASSNYWDETYLVSNMRITDVCRSNHIFEKFYETINSTLESIVTILGIAENDPKLVKIKKAVERYTILSKINKSMDEIDNLDAE